MSDLKLSEKAHNNVSIVVPVYNRATLVIDTLNSLLAQTHRPVEIIIVDDGFTDGSGDVVRRWRDENEAEDFRVAVLSQDNAGAPVARNKGLQVASGNYIAFLDSDDMYHPQCVEILLRGFICDPDIDCTICEIEDVVSSPTKSRREDVSSIHWSRKPLVFGKEFWATPNVLYKREEFAQVGGWNIRLKYGWQDRELCLRLSCWDFGIIGAKSH